MGSKVRWSVVRRVALVRLRAGKASVNPASEGLGRIWKQDGARWVEARGKVFRAYVDE